MKPTPIPLKEDVKIPCCIIVKTIYNIMTTEWTERVAFSPVVRRDSPTPSPAGEVVAPPLWFQGGNTLGGEGVGVPIRTRGQTLWYSRYICTVLCGQDLPINNGHVPSDNSP